MKKKIIIVSLLLLGITMFSPLGIQTKATASVGKYAKYWLTTEQKHRAEELTSVFENSTPVLDYAYVEDLGDGRGFTCGRAGFCTGTGDAVLVIKKYTDAVPNNVMAKYLPELIKLEDNRISTKHDQADVSGLNKMGNLINDWALAAKDAKFREAQDAVVTELYYTPSAEKADLLGLKLPLSRAELYDAIIQHGNEQNDLDSIDSLIARATDRSGGSPNSGIDEKAWLNNFLATRKATLSYCYKVGSREEWSESFNRVDVFSELVENNNYNLDKPITIKDTDWDGIIVP